MTDTSGICFLSYKRECSDQAALIVDALRDHGVAVWQDVSDLPAGITESEIRTRLNDQETACAVILVTPEVRNSPMIRDVEVEGIFRRVSQQDGFFAQLVLADGVVDYKDADEILGTRTSGILPSSKNCLKFNGKVDADIARKVAEVVLKNRLIKLNETSQDAGPIRIRVNTRQPPLRKEVGYALNLDLCHHYDGRLLKPDSWKEFIQPAFLCIKNKIHENFSTNRILELSGQLSLPIAVSLGVTFSNVSGLKANWIQENSRAWGENVDREDSGFKETILPREVNGNEYALLVSVTSDVINFFGAIANTLPLRAMINVKPNGVDPNRNLRLTPGEALDVANVATCALRRAIDQYGRRGTVHLVIAGPAGLAFLIGQKLNTISSVQTYEFINTSECSYVPALTLFPNQ
ncbi:SAVED domain-containing protein [Gynuella sunshinyii]|uniref:SMODS-associated and fused to various effectors domain-containing protein n=1 Tax=Gynuella sunshinyii YC6258 TaxID=1445510 RepID=A0A0C5VPX5_9GAMM|nr:SAVED domain-containing protein [Gynuella sunshinyii]AJQ96667.1 hypothetical Protein YC6258_04635 [Gynuella sunshinyii YC6258]